MKLVLPNIDNVFIICTEYINEIIIENQNLLLFVVRDLFNQVNGLDGQAVLSENEKPILLSKNMEVIDRFVPFELNRKTLLNKVVSELERRAIDPEVHADTLELLCRVEKYFWDISFDMIGDIGYEAVNIGSLIKAIGVSFNEDYDGLGEKIIDYFELVYEYDRRKVFILLGLRSYLNDEEMRVFADTVLRQGYWVVLLEPVERPVINGVKRYIIDRDLCEIG